jgi:NDP-sugar pyrophosphorylase family protein
VKGVYNQKPIYLCYPWNIEEVKRIMVTKKIEVIPVLNSRREIIDVLIWSDIFKEKSSAPREKIDLPLVIMAGGRGTRLDPFTRILPKPLIPIGDKPVVEIIIDRIVEWGVRDIYITLNYKGEMVKTYFEYREDLPYRIHYISEKEFLGTAGSLRLLPDELSETFILTNCDVIVDADYYDVLRHHKKSNNIITLLGSIQNYTIPYGIVRFNSGGIVEEIEEKPEYDLTVNTGIYIMQKNSIQYIPENKSFDITELINQLIRKGEKVGVYPVSEKSYVDIGQWEEYRKSINLLKE